MDEANLWGGVGLSIDLGHNDTNAAVKNQAGENVAKSKIFWVISVL